MSPELTFEVSAYIKRALEEDIGTGDVTTDTIVPVDAVLRGRIVAKQGGVVAGLEVARHVMLALNKQITFTKNVLDGSSVTRGSFAVEGFAFLLVLANASLSVGVVEGLQSRPMMRFGRATMR